MNSDKVNILMDFDDVITFTSEEVYRNIRLLWSKYNIYFKNIGPLSRKDIYARDKVNYLDWIGKDNYNSLSDDDKIKLKELYISDLKKDILQDNIYDNLEPTPLAKKTLGNKFYIDSPKINHIYILTKCDDISAESKKKFIDKWFSSDKISLLPVMNGAKKSDVVKANNIDWGLFIDDDLSNIADFAENMDIDHKEFLIPRYGYNKMNTGLSILIKEKGGVFTYYDPER